MTSPRIILGRTNKITVLFLSWRDIKSPKMGGAEIYTHEMMRHADLSILRIIHFSPMFDGANSNEYIDGIMYIRKGNLFSLIWECRKFYILNKNSIDYVVDQCNTYRFFTKFWVEDRKRIFLIFQLTKEIWDIHLRFPFSKIGKLLEIPMLRLNRHDLTITESESTKKDLESIGFKNIKILPIGLNKKPYDKSDLCEKESTVTFIYIGRFAKYKGIDTCISAFGEFKKINSDAKLWIVGKKDDKYIERSLAPICLQYGLLIDKDIIFYGFVTEDKKLELMSRAHLLLFPSIREGWGLIITEAAVVGTPSIVFNSPGLVDAVDFGNAGYITKRNDYKGIFETMVNAIEDKITYEKMRDNAYTFSSRFKWEDTGREFTNIVLGLEKLQQGNK
jgi:glycosyltransferase involved in cell wall biosynthesis